MSTATFDVVSGSCARHAPAESSFVLISTANGASGSHKERAAWAVVAAAATDGYRGVTAGSCGNYALAIAVAAAGIGLSAVVVVPAGWSRWGTYARSWGADVVFVEGTYEDAVSASHVLAQQGMLADGNVDGPYAGQAQAALAVLVDELAQRLDQTPAVIWVPLGNGTTISAIGMAVQARAWPTRLVGVTSQSNNSIAASWPGSVHRPIAAADLCPTAINEPLVNWDALHGQPALDAIRRSGGTVLALTDAELLSVGDLGWALGGASPSGVAGVAGYALGGHELTSLAGVHVAVLTDRAIDSQQGAALEDGCG